LQVQLNSYKKGFIKMSSPEDLQLDISDLEKLIESSTRSVNKAKLKSLLSEANLKLEQATAENQDKGGVAEHTELPGVAKASNSSSVRPATSPSSAGTVAVPLGVEFSPISTFGWDQSNKFVSVFVSEGMEGVKTSGAQVNCEFDTDAFDLTIRGHKGKSFRLARKGLDKDIDPKKSKVKVKDNRVVVMLKKIQGEYGPDHWTDLVPKRKRKTNKDDPTAGIMDLMKDMYNDGDDQMKKTIGEAMMKSQQERMKGDFGM
jgi:calcyclin binding protein